MLFAEKCFIIFKVSSGYEVKKFSAKFHANLKKREDRLNKIAEEADAKWNPNIKKGGPSR